MEDTTPAEENQQFLRIVRERTTTPIAIGEIINSWSDCITLIQEQLIDYVRSAVTHTGGLTHMKKLMAFIVSLCACNADNALTRARRRRSSRRGPRSVGGGSVAC